SALDATRLRPPLCAHIDCTAFPPNVSNSCEILVFSESPRFGLCCRLCSTSERYATGSNRPMAVPLDIPHSEPWSAPRNLGNSVISTSLRTGVSRLEHRHDVHRLPASGVSGLDH